MTPGRYFDKLFRYSTIYSVLLNMFNVFCIYCLHLLALVLFMDVSNLKKNPSIFECTSMHKSVKFSNTFLKQALISNIYSNGWSDCHVDCQKLLNAANTKNIIHCLFVSLVTKSIFFFQHYDCYNGYCLSCLLAPCTGWCGSVSVNVTFIFYFHTGNERRGVRGAERPRQLTRNTHRTPRPEKRRGTSRQPPPAPDIPAPDSRCVGGGGEEQSPGSRS